MTLHRNDGKISDVSSTTDTPELSCREIVAFLDDYLEGTLPAPARARFEEHLAVCPQCVAYLDSYRATIRLGKEALTSDGELSQAPAELVEAILAARLSQSSRR